MNLPKLLWYSVAGLGRSRRSRLSDPGSSEKLETPDTSEPADSMPDAELSGPKGIAPTALTSAAACPRQSLEFHQ